MFLCKFYYSSKISLKYLKWAHNKWYRLNHRPITYFKTAQFYTFRAPSCSWSSKIYGQLWHFSKESIFHLIFPVAPCKSNFPAILCAVYYLTCHTFFILLSFSQLSYFFAARKFWEQKKNCSKVEICLHNNNKEKIFQLGCFAAFQLSAELAKFPSTAPEKYDKRYFLLSLNLHLFTGVERDDGYY